MNDIVPMNDLPQSDGFLISSGSVSFQIVQEVYAKITKKTERLKKTWDKNCVFEFGSIEQINARMVQYFESMNVVANECSITVCHKDDLKETFSSFERFRLYNVSTVSPIEYISIEYNYLLILPKTREPRNYCIKIMVINGLVVYEQMKNDGVPAEIRHRLSKHTITASVDYTDYVVGQTIMGVISTWVEAIQEVKEEKWLKRIQKIDNHFPSISKWLIGFIALIESIRSLPHYIVRGENELKLLGVAIVVSIVFVFFCYRIGLRLGNTTSEYFDSMLPLARININAGDKKIYDEYLGSNRHNSLMAIAALAGTVAVGVLTNYIYDLAKIFFGL